jgi:hypothetical protein
MGGSFERALQARAGGIGGCQSEQGLGANHAVRGEAVRALEAAHRICERGVQRSFTV